MKRGKEKTLEVYDRKTGELITSGTTAKCIAVVGLCPTSFRKAAKSSVHRLKIVDTTGSVVSSGEYKSDQEAIEGWDAFVEPLRKKFGIPVRRERRER